jgi:predicted phosphodiesterase
VRLAIISDVHGNLVALEAVLADIKSRRVDLTINLGDCVTSPLWPREALDLLETIAAPTVRGNHDRWIAEGPPPRARLESIAFSHDALSAAQRAALGGLPPAIELDGGVLAVHGTPASDSEYLLEEAVAGRLALAPRATLARRIGATTATLVLCGHSHHQHLAHVPGGPLVLNPGSVGCPRYADNDDHLSHEAGSPHARYAIATRNQRGWNVELFAIDYDWSLVAARAVANGRRDWAEGFLGE